MNYHNDQLVGSDVALNWYRKGHGFKSRKGLNFLSPCFHYSLSGLYYYEDRFHIQRWKTVTIYTSIHFYFWKSVKKIRKLFSPRYFTWHLALGLVNIWTFQKLSANKKKTNKQTNKYKNNDKSTIRRSKMKQIGHKTKNFERFIVMRFWMGQCLVWDFISKTRFSHQ